MRILWYSLAAMLWGCITVSAQKPTVGLITKDSLAVRGYTLFAPLQNDTTFLIDNCGYLVHTWSSKHYPGFNVRLLENGTLLRTLRLDTSPIQGGAGGGIELRTWDGDEVWSYVISDSTQLCHHDAMMLPNGNILTLVAVNIPRADVIDAGRDSSSIDKDLWADEIVELKPIGKDSAEIVWRWSAWDHIIQDRKPTAPKYGIISQNPGKVDLNFHEKGFTTVLRDWTHLNSVDYNPTLDQVLVSARAFDEVWVIDHSTTTEEARGSSGGIYKHGGDLIYRWGNPQAYGRGDSTNQVFYGQHDAHWITGAVPDAGKIAVFNNGANRPGGTFSSVDVFAAAMDEDGSYPIASDNTFGPHDLSWQYKDSASRDMYSFVFSSSQFFANGNVLVCSGSPGVFREVDRSGNIHWQYVCPVSITGRMFQGMPALSNFVFQAIRYLPDYPAFAGRSLDAGAPIERNPFPYTCSDLPAATDVIAEEQHQQLNASPNPFSDELTISLSTPTTYCMYNETGCVMQSGHADASIIISTTAFARGVYYLRTEGGAVVKLIKVF